MRGKFQGRLVVFWRSCVSRWAFASWSWGEEGILHSYTWTRLGEHVLKPPSQTTHIARHLVLIVNQCSPFFPVQSRSLLFYDEGAGSLEESYSSFLTMDHPEGWEAKKRQSEEGRPHLARTHETAKYLSKTQEGPDQNQTDPTLNHLKEQFRAR